MLLIYGYGPDKDRWVCFHKILRHDGSTWSCGKVIVLEDEKCLTGSKKG